MCARKGLMHFRGKTKLQNTVTSARLAFLIDCRVVFSETTSPQPGQGKQLC
jgi:hypothetical protein